MDDLPSEITIDIASHLATMSDRINLACVCKQLYKIITENALYNKLVLNDKFKFDQAMDLCNKKNFGQLVHHLRIQNVDHNSEILSALPTTFPNVRFVEAYSGDGEYVLISRQDFDEVVEKWKNWKNLETIVGPSIIMNVTIGLLEQGLMLDRLTSLEVDCEKFMTASERTQALINGLHNAPSLERLAISHAVVKITDVEKLHAQAPKLKHLLFDVVGVYTSDVHEQIVHHAAKSLETFSMKNIRPPPKLRNEQQVLDDGIKNWISYIGKKYLQVRHLCLQLNFYSWDESNFIQDIDSVTMSMVEALKNMQQLKSYSVDFCSASKPVFNVMKANGVQLDHYGFLLSNDDTLKETLESIKIAQSISTVKSLEFGAINEIDTLVLSTSFINLCLDLKCLTSLEFISDRDDVALLFFDIMHNLTMLKTLVFKEVTIGEQTLEDDVFYNKVSTIQKTRLESARLSLYCTPATKDPIKKLNLLFKFVLQSCPDLKRIDLSTSGYDINARGGIYLDFRENHALKHIKMYMPNCRYYAFHHEFGKYWRNINDQIMRDDFTAEEDLKYQYYFNLAWNTSKNIKLELSGCGV